MCFTHRTVLFHFGPVCYFSLLQSSRVGRASARLTLSLPPDIMKKSSGLLVCCSQIELVQFTKSIHRQIFKFTWNISWKYVKIQNHMKPSSWTNVRRSICEENRDDFAQNQWVGHHRPSQHFTALPVSQPPSASREQCCEDTFHWVNAKARFQADLLLIQGFLLQKSPAWYSFDANAE